MERCRKCGNIQYEISDTSKNKKKYTFHCFECALQIFLPQKKQPESLLIKNHRQSILRRNENESP